MKLIPKMLIALEKEAGIVPISGGYNTLTKEEQADVDKAISAGIIDEAISTLQEMKKNRPNADYRDLVKAFGTLIELHRKIEGKDKQQTNVQVNISLSDIVKKSSETPIIDAEQ